MKIIFSVLHYEAIEMTLKCIESLKNIKDNSYEIVVVDNNSPNGSGKTLKEKFCNDNNIHVILNDKNVGFARGNNIGYRFAKEELKADVIVMMNNDVIIKQQDFVCELRKIVSNDQADIIGPNIINLLGEYQNPVRLRKMYFNELLWHYIYNLTSNLILRIPIINKKFVLYVSNRNKSKVKDENIPQKRILNIVPHGSIVIFNTHYINNEEYAFLPITFLFCEEDILYEYALKKEYIISYEPSLNALHHEDISINSVNSSEIEKRKFISKHKLKSLLSLCKVKYGKINL